MTSTAVRQHLDDLERSGLVRRLEAVRSGGRGRPHMPWALTDLATDLFPDRHSDLTVELISAIRTSVGEDGLDAVITERTNNQRKNYSRSLDRADRSTVEAQVVALANIRSAEGYMAEVSTGGDGTVTLTEHHCPICDAAASCQGLCRDELQLFKDVLGPGVAVERVEHLLSGDSRCTYRVTPVTIEKR